MRSDYFEWRDAMLSSFLRPTARLMLHTLLLYITPGHKMQCFPGSKRLAAQMGVNERTVKRTRTELEAAGWLVVNRVPNPSGGFPMTVYSLARWGAPVHESSLEVLGDQVSARYAQDRAKGRKMSGSLPESPVPQHAEDVPPPAPGFDD